MKNTKKGKARRSSFQRKAPSRTARRLFAQIRIPFASRARRNSPELIPVSLTDGLAVDSVVMARLHEALARIDGPVVNACTYRKLLPHSFASAITEALLLAYALVPARAAQDVTGVPASILIAEMWHESPVDVHETPEGNDYFGTGGRFLNIEESVLDHACWLRNEKEFQPVMRAAGDPVQYLREIARCKMWDEQGRLDRADIVRRIQECDKNPEDHR
jgi:hypothetical protein